MNIRFTLLLITLIGMLLVLPLAAASSRGLVWQSALAWCVIVAGVWAVGESARTRRIAVLLAGLVLVFDAVLWTHPGNPLMPLGRIAVAAFLGFVTCVILDHIVSQEEVTFDVVVGSICTYILIAAFFAQVYAAFLVANPAALLEHGRPVSAVGPSDLARGHIVEVVYYSLVTLTTLGFGDIIPGTPMVRAVSTVEGLIGQMYPAVLIAHLVGMRASQGPVRRRHQAAERTESQ